MGYNMINLPPQQLSFKSKTKKWRKQHLDWADSKTFYNYSPVRKSVINKKINYDLMNGKIHMKDVMLVLNPDDLKGGFIPDKIQHYPIINSKLNVLKGEEYKRVFDFSVVVTNPNSISSLENTKRQELLTSLENWVKQEMSQEEAQKELEKIMKYYTYEYQDLREIRANALLNHYYKELNMPLIFNSGFMDAAITGEELYQCDIVSGEPVLRKLNPLKVRAFKSGYSNRIEDADIIIIEDYWSPGKIIDTFYDSLTSSDMKYIENLPYKEGQVSHDSMDNIDDRAGFINLHMVSDVFNTENLFTSDSEIESSLLPYDTAGNIRVIQMYWKSRRKIKEIKSYDPLTGGEIYTFHTEEYIPDETLGEEENIYWINEAWEGTKIGEHIYVNMRPRQVQYNRLSNPSICHFGIIGSIYNLNDTKPFSMVDIMKPYSYAYDVIHDRLNKLLARTWGTMVKLDFAKVPKGWDIEKWLYYAKTMGIAVENSFNEGDYGPAAGKLAGSLNNASSGVIPAADGSQIQQYINLLEFFKNEMSDSIGITRQREGQISNRETVGGVERSTLQSTHITEWVFSVHEDLKKRVLECFLETAKIAMRGKNKKFQYILSDHSNKLIDIDGDTFSESDYGLVVDCSNNVQVLNQKLEGLAQTALQSQMISFSTLMKLFTSASIAEKQRFIENSENEIKQQQEQQQQQQQQLAQQQQQAAMEAQKQQQEWQIQFKQMEFEHQNEINERDNQTRVTVAEIQAANLASRYQKDTAAIDAFDQQKFNESVRQFNTKLNLEKDRDFVAKQNEMMNQMFKQEKLKLDRQKYQEKLREKERVNKKQS